MGAAYLAIAASDPETLKGVDPDRLVRSQKSGSVLRKTFDRLQMSNGFPWCIASVPIPSWPPPCSGAAGGSGHGKAVGCHSPLRPHSGRRHRRFRMAPASGHPGPPEKLLNEYHFKYLHYTNSLGTDLTIQLPEDHLWAAGNSVMKNGGSSWPTCPRRKSSPPL